MGCHQGPWDGRVVRGPFAVMWTGQQKTNEEARKRDRKVGGHTREACSGLFLRPWHTPALGFTGTPVIRVNATLQFNHALVGFCWLKLKASQLISSASKPQVKRDKRETVGEA